jgi:hypothetical protein
VTGAPPWSQGLYDGKIRIPVRFVKNVKALDRVVLKHELVHALIHLKTAGNCPIWLHEGLAQFFSGERYRTRSASCGGAVYPFEEKKNVQEQYANAVSMIEFVVSTRGEQRLKQILEELAAGGTWPDALKRVLFTDRQRFLKDWQTWCYEEKK